MTFRTRGTAASLICLLLLTTSAAAQGPSGLKRITVASAVRVRSGPSTSATVLETLSIGVLLDEKGRSDRPDKVGEQQDYWYRVELPNRKEGWVFGGLTQAVDPSAVDDAFVRIANERLSRSDLNFSDQMDAVDFLGRAAKTASSDEAKGRLEMAHLQMIQKSLDGISYEQREQSPYKAWIAKQEATTVRLDEIQGAFLVSQSLYWDIAEKYATTKAGDDLSWAAAEAQLGGECEGDLSCNIFAFNIMRGRYLASWPAGRRAAKVVNDLIAYLDETKAGMIAEPGAYAMGSDDTVWIADFRKALADIRGTLKKTSVDGRDRALALLDDIEKLATR